MGERLLIMSIRFGCVVICEELAEIISSEVPLHVLFLVHHTAAQCLLMFLSLKYFLFYCTSL